MLRGGKRGKRIRRACSKNLVIGVELQSDRMELCDQNMELAL